MDLRSTRLLGELNAIGVAPTEGGLGLPTPQRIRVGVPEQSVLWHRQQSTDAGIRMPDGSLVPDPAAVPVFDTWIGSGLATLESDEDTLADRPTTARASRTRASPTREGSTRAARTAQRRLGRGVSRACRSS